MKLHLYLFLQITKMLEISFNEQQLEAIDKIKRFLIPINPAKIFILSGYAGTGKTTVISALTHSPSYKYKKIVLTATTNKAVAVIQSVANKYERNIKYATIHKLLKTKRVIDNNGYESYIMNVDETPDQLNKKSIHYYDLIIVDEASMVSKQLFESIVKISKTIKGKFIFLGDKMQLPPVNEKISLVFELSTPNKASLTKVERVKNNILILSMRIRNSIESKNKIKFKDLICDHLTYFRDFNKFIENYCNKLREEQNQCIVLAYTNNRCKKINDTVRSILFGKVCDKFTKGELIIFNNFYKGVNRNFYTSQQATVKSVEVSMKIFPQIDFTQLLNLQTSMFCDDNLNSIAPIKETITDEDKLCPICLNEEVDTLRETLCGHIFCSTCIKLWLDNNNTCPLCRMEFKDKKIVYLKDLPEINKTIEYLNNLLSSLKFKTYNIELESEEENETIICLHEDDKQNFETQIDNIKNILRDISSKTSKKDKFASVVLNRLWEFIYMNYIDVFADISYGYCITTHKSQGSNYKNVFVDVKNILEFNTRDNENLKCFYTAVTRSAGYLSLLN